MEEFLEALWAVLELGIYGVHPLVVIFLLLLLTVTLVVAVLLGAEL